MNRIRDMDKRLKFVYLNIKQTQKCKQRRLIATTMALILVLLITANVTIAYLNTYTGTKINKFGFGQAKVEVIENDDYDWEKKEVRLTVPIPAKDSEEILVPGVARVMFIPYILNGEGSYISCDLGEMKNPADNKMVLGDILLEFAGGWEEHWFYQNGYFYYKKVLYPEAGRNETPVLLKRVSFNGDIRDMMEKYHSREIKIEVNASILQAGAPESGNVLQEEWNVIVGGDTVSPKT